MLKVYGIKNCDTMKKAFAWLEANAVAYEFIDYKQPDVAQNHLPDWNRRAGWQRLLNTNGMMWKRLSDEERVDVDEAKARWRIPVATCSSASSLSVTKKH